MPDYICPACKGGFPETAMLDGTACPWCEFMLQEAVDLMAGDYWSHLEGLKNR